MARNKIYINPFTQSLLTSVKEGLNLKSYDAVVLYLYSIYKPIPQPPEPVWIDRGKFLTPIQPGTPTHINQNLPLSEDAIREVMRPSMKDQPLSASNIVRVELPPDDAGKFRIKYVNKGITKPIPIPVQPIEEPVEDDDEDDELSLVPLLDDDLRDNAVNTFPLLPSKVEEPPVKKMTGICRINKFSLRDDK
jgi:hypothetical protein